MRTKDNPEELTEVLIKFVIVALLFILGCIWNNLTNNV